MNYADILNQISEMWDIFIPFIIIHITSVILYFYIEGYFKGNTINYSQCLKSQLEYLSKLSNYVLTIIVFITVFLFFSYYRLTNYLWEETSLPIVNKHIAFLYPYPDNIIHTPYEKYLLQSKTNDSLQSGSAYDKFLRTCIFKYSIKYPEKYSSIIRISKGSMTRSGQFLSYDMLFIFIGLILFFFKIKKYTKNPFTIRYIISLSILLLFYFISRYNMKYSINDLMLKEKIFAIECLKMNENNN